METWDLDGEDISRIRALLQHDVLFWGADVGGDLTVTIQGGEGSLRAWPLSDSQDDGNDLLAFATRAATLLHGHVPAGKSLAELAEDIEHLVERAWQLQDRVVELERARR